MTTVTENTVANGRKRLHEKLVVRYGSPYRNCFVSFFSKLRSSPLCHLHCLPFLVGKSVMDVRDCRGKLPLRLLFSRRRCANCVHAGNSAVLTQTRFRPTESRRGCVDGSCIACICEIRGSGFSGERGRSEICCVFLCLMHACCQADVCGPGCLLHNSTQRYSLIIDYTCNRNTLM